jgi:hypothetical protein
LFFVIYRLKNNTILQLFPTYFSAGEKRQRFMVDRGEPSRTPRLFQIFLPHFSHLLLTAVGILIVVDDIVVVAVNIAVVVVVVVVALSIVSWLSHLSHRNGAEVAHNDDHYQNLIVFYRRFFHKVFPNLN